MIEYKVTQKKVAIIQSNYIPWKGYFDFINMVDEFILFDDTQYTRRDWRNRNLIKTSNGLRWLTIPVEVKGRYHQSISETRISSAEWAIEHWKAIAHNYTRARYFRQYREIFEPLYRGCCEPMLSIINKTFLDVICRILNICTPITCIMNYRSNCPSDSAGDKTLQLVSLCKAAGASCYISGPAAQNYINPEAFKQAGIELKYIDYSGYPEYPQFFPLFTHNVSVLDLLFHTGPKAPYYIWGWRDKDARPSL